MNAIKFLLHDLRATPELSFSSDELIDLFAFLRGFPLALDSKQKIIKKIIQGISAE